MPIFNPTPRPAVGSFSPALYSSVLAGRQSEPFTIVQISDLHLSHVFQDPPDPSVQGFTQVLGYLADHRNRVDLLVVTGDLVHDVLPANYDYLFERLYELNVPFICQAGNHDVTQELDPELPFVQRRHVAVEPDSRLVINEAIDTPDWRLLFLNSAKSGEIAGFYTPETLIWLTHQLGASDKPSVIFTHHPSWSVQSRWIDSHQLQNPEQFWQVVEPFTSKIKAVFSGHVHQESHYQKTFASHTLELYTVPSTSVQFLRYSDDFALDTQSAVGLREITLYNNATLATCVKRMDTT